MVTGIEVIGLTLAIAPIIISGIEHYREGIRPFKLWAKYEKDLCKLREILDLEMAKFWNTIQHLLAPILPPARLAAILDQPQENWFDPRTQNELIIRMGYAYSPFVNAARNFYEAMDELREKLESQHSKNMPKGARQCLEYELDRIKYAFSRERRNELRQNLKKSNKAMRELVEDTPLLLHAESKAMKKGVALKHVRRTAENVYDALAKAPWSCQCRGPHYANLVLDCRTRHFATVSDSAKQPPTFRILFCLDNYANNQISEWRETEIVPLANTAGHVSQGSVAELKAQFPNAAADAYVPVVQASSMRSFTAIDLPRPKISAKSASDHATVTIAGSARGKLEHSADKECRPRKKKILKWTCDAGKAPTPSEQSSPRLSNQSTLKPIVNFCATLHLVAEGSRKYLGLVEASSSEKFGILPIRRHPRGLTSDDTLSLEDFMVRDEGCHSSMSIPPYHLNGKDKRFLAKCLASTLLQLYDTSWLNRRLGRENVRFLPELSESKKPIIEQPLVSSPFRFKGCSSELGRERAGLVSYPPLIRNKAIFDLGVLLIEICFCRRLSTMRTADDLDENMDVTQYTDLMTAERQLDRVYSEAGVRYGDAVRRCIRQEFDQREESLESEDFLEAVYKLVVAPLEDELRHFCDGS